jgi:hypothetical protein
MPKPINEIATAAKELVKQSKEISGPLAFQASSNSPARRSDVVPIAEFATSLAQAIADLAEHIQSQTVEK